MHPDWLLLVICVYICICQYLWRCISDCSILGLCSPRAVILPGLIKIKKWVLCIGFEYKTWTSQLPFDFVQTFQLSFRRADVWSLQNDTALFLKCWPPCQALNACPSCQYLWNYWDNGVLLLHWYWQALTKSRIPPEKLPVPENGWLSSFFVPLQRFFSFVFPGEEWGMCVLNCGLDPNHCKPDRADSYNREY